MNVNVNVPSYNPAKRKRAVNVAWQEDRPWRNGRHVRILHPAFGYDGKIGIITSVGERFVYVRIKLGKKLGDWAEVAYLPEHLRLIAK